MDKAVKSKKGCKNHVRFAPPLFVIFCFYLNTPGEKCQFAIRIKYAGRQDFAGTNKNNHITSNKMPRAFQLAVGGNIISDERLVSVALRYKILCHGSIEYSDDFRDIGGSVCSL